MMRAALSLALLLSAAAAPAQQPRQQGGNIEGPYGGGQYRMGPLHFCTGYVAVEIPAGDHVVLRQGPDYDVFDIDSRDGSGFGLYTGNAPERGYAAPTPTVVAGLPAEKLQSPDGAYSYMIHVPHAASPAYVHLFGAIWKGDARDAALLSRIHIGQPAAIGCAHPTFRH
jgi:hypothetical protein